MTLKSASIWPILAIFFVCNPLVGQNAAGALEWGVSKGDKFTWELKSLTIGSDYSATYQEAFGIFGEAAAIGDKIECEIATNLPATLDALNSTESEDLFDVKVGGTEIDLGTQKGTLRDEDEDENYLLEPAWIIPQGDLQAWLYDYKDEWNDMAFNRSWIGTAFFWTSTDGKKVLEVSTWDVDFNTGVRTAGFWNITLSYALANGVMQVYDFFFEDTLEFRIELISAEEASEEPTSDDDHGLIGAKVELSIVPVIFALAIAAVTFHKARKKH